MKYPLAEQLFTVFLLSGALEARFTEQKLLMNLINLHKKVSREITTAGNSTLYIQHESFAAIILLNDKTQQLTNVMVRMRPELFQEMLRYARSQHWREMRPMSENTQIEWQQDGAGLSHKLLLKQPAGPTEKFSVAFFDYPGIFDAPTVHFRREVA